MRDHALTNGERPFLLAGGRWTNYGEFWAMVGRGRHWLIERGVKPGDRVLLSAGGDDLAFPIFYLATHLAGAISVPIDAKIGSATKAAIRSSTDPKLILEGRDAKSALGELDTGMSESTKQSFALPAQPATADLLFTSGTTGEPKGVMLSHRSILAAAQSINCFIGNDAEDREVVTVPLSHSFGLGRLRCCILAGGSMILMPGLSFPAATLAVIDDIAVSGLSCVPAGLAILLRWGEDQLRSAATRLRYIELGSAPMSETLKRELSDLFPSTRLCMHYGLTEASRSCFMEFHDDANRLATVGTPSPGVEVEVRDPDNVRLPINSEGLIHIRSPAMMQGYWRAPDATLRACPGDGWLRTSDIGSQDKLGYLTLVGRVDDQINVGGKKVDPRVVEDSALSFEGIEQAACIGVDDPNGLVGQTPVLFVVPIGERKLDVSALRGHLAVSLDPHMRPTRIEQVGDLPRTESGKLKRVELRKSQHPVSLPNVDR